MFFQVYRNLDKTISMGALSLFLHDVTLKHAQHASVCFNNEILFCDFDSRLLVSIA